MAAESTTLLVVYNHLVTVSYNATTNQTKKKPRLHVESYLANQKQ